MGSAQAGIYSGLGQGISGAGQAVMQALYMAQAQKLQQQQLGIQQQGVSQTGTQQQFQRDTEAANFYQQTGQDRAGYSQGLPIGAGGQSPTSGGAGTGGATPPPLPATATAPVPTPGNLTQSQAVPPPRSPIGVGGGAGVSPVLQALQAAQATPQGAPNAGGPSLMPGADQLAALPPAMRREALMNALVAGQQFKQAAALKGVPQAVNPQELALQTGAQQEEIRHNKATEQAALAGENERTAALNNQISYQGEMLGKGYGTEYQNMIKPIVQRAPAYRAFDQASAQYQAGNPASTKALLLAAVPLLDPQSRMTARLMQITQYAGDPSLVGQWQQQITTAATGKLPDEDVKNLKQAVEARKQNDFDALDQVGQSFKEQHSNIKNIDRQVLPTPALMAGVKPPGAVAAPVLSARDAARAATDPGFAAFLKAHAAAPPAPAQAP